MTERRARIKGSAVSTGRGDDGTTGLLFGGERIPKDDPRAEAYGTLDEAVAVLGLARAELEVMRRYGVLPSAFAGTADLLLRLQRELFVAGAELASNRDAWDRLEDGATRVSEAMVEGLEEVLADVEHHVSMPREFVVPGETLLSASLEVARTVVRRAERRTVSLQRADALPGPWLLPYLNRLADLLWVLARAAEAAETAPPTPARLRPRERRRSGQDA